MMLVMLTLFAMTPLAALGQAPLPPEIENPAVTQINKELPHATLMPYATQAQALGGLRRESPFARSLNGTWKFHYVPEPSARPVDFWKPEFDVSGWDNIPVPSCWQLRGYGTPYYLNATYPFRVDPPHVMSEPPRNWTAYEERNPVGSYRREFEVPPAWDGRRVFITFDGVDSAFYLWVNGRRVGYSTDARTPAEFDLTDYVHPGTNMIALEVYRYSIGSYLEDQDMFRLSGIFRNVTLWSAPQVHVRDFFALPDLDAEYRDATLKVTAKLRNYGSAPAEARSLAVELHDTDALPVPGASAQVAVPALGPGEEAAVEVTLNVAAPAKWTAETPNLYTTVLRLEGPGGPEELLSCRTGFRKVEIKGRVFTINGVPVKLKGTNRHENWPEDGHAITEAETVRDLELVKQANMNHVRTSHYSDDPRWYELCDQYGIYLVAESNVEDHGCHAVTESPDWERVFVERQRASVERDKNHAAVVIWSLGNECGGGRNMHAALAAVKALDTSRPTHYEGFGIGNNNPADIDSNMYAHPYWVDRIAQDGGYTKPYYLCEYAHAMSNSMGAIGDYNDLFDKYDTLMGGAIWEWQDQALWNRRDPERPFLAYGGGFGEVPNDNVFILKGVVFADRQRTPKYPEAKKAYQWVQMTPGDLATGQVHVRNRYAFLNLSRFEAAWEVTCDGAVVQSGALPRLDIAPGQSADVTVPLRPITPAPGAEYFLRLFLSLATPEPWAPAGYEVATEQFKLLVAAPATVASAELPALTATETDEALSLSAPGFSAAFSKVDGALSSLVYGGREMLRPAGGPRLLAYRAPHLNDDLWAAGSWKGVGLDTLPSRLISLTWEQPSPGVVQVSVSLDAIGKGEFGISQALTYTISGDGTVAVDTALVPRGPRVVVPRLGARLVLNAALDHFTWLGRGPMENYSDRKRGSDVGLYGSTVAEQLTPYQRPMECGNHEDVRWAAVTDGQGAGLLVTCESGVMQTSALPYGDEQLEPAPYPKDLPASEATYLCLSAITLGVGSAGCGPAPLDKYVTHSDPLTFSYSLRPAPGGFGKLPALARLASATPRVAPVLATREPQGGKVALTCATEGATLQYALDGGDWQPYTEPLALTRATMLSFHAGAAGMLPFSGQAWFPKILDRSKWRVVSASSFESGEGDVEHLIDGNAGTFWHSRWSRDVPKHPHEFVLDFGEPLALSAVVYQGRQDMVNGRVGDYEIYLSNDPDNWGGPALKGRFGNNADRQVARLRQPVTARYLRFVALSEVTGQAFATVAELSIVPVDE